MENFIREDYFLELIQKVFFNLINEQEITSSLLNLNDHWESLYDNKDFYIYLILLNKINKNCAQQILFDKIENTILLQYLTNININIEEKKEEKENISDQENFETIFLKKYSNIKDLEGLKVQLPKENSKIKVSFRDTLTIPGKEYFVSVNVDNEGNILSFEEQPLEIATEDEILEIYDGLFGHLTNYNDTIEQQQ